MAQPIHRIVHNRHLKFKPDIIWTLVFAGNNFKVVKENPEKYAELAINEKFWKVVENAKNQELGGNNARQAKNFVESFKKD